MQLAHVSETQHAVHMNLSGETARFWLSSVTSLWSSWTTWFIWLFWAQGSISESLQSWKPVISMKKDGCQNIHSSKHHANCNNFHKQSKSNFNLTVRDWTAQDFLQQWNHTVGNLELVLAPELFTNLFDRSFSRSLTHSLVKRPHQQSSPVYRAWLCCSGFCPQLRSVLHLAWWVSRTYPTPLRDKVKQRIVLQTISAPANLQFLKLEQWTHWLYHFHPSLKALPLNYHDTISPYLIKRKSYLHALSIQPACHIPFFRTLGIFKICKILTVQCTPAPGVLVHLGDSRFLDGLDRLDGGFGSLGVPEVYNFIQHKNPQEQSQKF